MLSAAPTFLHHPSPAGVSATPPASERPACDAMRRLVEQLLTPEDDQPDTRRYLTIGPNPSAVAVAVAQAGGQIDMLLQAGQARSLVELAAQQAGLDRPVNALPWDLPGGPQPPRIHHAVICHTMLITTALEHRRRARLEWLWRALRPRGTLVLVESVDESPIRGHGSILDQEHDAAILAVEELFDLADCRVVADTSGRCELAVTARARERLVASIQ